MFRKEVFYYRFLIYKNNSFDKKMDFSLHIKNVR